MRRGRCSRLDFVVRRSCSSRGFARLGCVGCGGDGCAGCCLFFWGLGFGGAVWLIVFFGVFSGEGGVWGDAVGVGSVWGSLGLGFCLELWVLGFELLLDLFGERFVWRECDGLWLIVDRRSVKYWGSRGRKGQNVRYVYFRRWMLLYSVILNIYCLM